MKIEIRNEDERKWLNKFIKKHSEENKPLVNREPTENEISNYMKDNNENYYTTRETLREQSYGGKAPFGFQSWGDYHKSL